MLAPSAPQSIVWDIRIVDLGCACTAYTLAAHVSVLQRLGVLCRSSECNAHLLLIALDSLGATREATGTCSGAFLSQ